MPIRSIPPIEGQEAVPPTSGNWLRAEDGTLTPADEATARTAGLWDDEPAPEPTPSE